MKPLTTCISRRHVLTTGTAVIALPAFESLGFRRCAAAAAGATAAQVRRGRMHMGGH